MDVVIPEDAQDMNDNMISDRESLFPGSYCMDGICMPSFVSRKHLEYIKTMKIDSTDVMVTGYPKSGNMWTTVTVQAILNADNLDMFTKTKPNLASIDLDIPEFREEIKHVISPRVLMSHLRYSMLPTEAKEKNVKIIHIRRNPKDVVVSYYHFSCMYKLLKYQGSWQQFLTSFMEGTTPMGSWLDYTKDWSTHAENPNVLFIAYEDFLADVSATISRIADFLGKDLSSGVIDKISDIVTFDSMKSNPNLNRMHLPLYDNNKGEFLRSGRAGDWKNQFTDEQERHFNQVFQDFI